MKKRLSIFVVLTLVVSMLLTACGPNAKSYMEQAEAAQKWEAIEGKAHLDMNFKMTDPESKEELKLTFPVDMTMYSVGEDKAEIKYSFDMKEFKKLLAGEEGVVEVPEKMEFSVFADGNKVVMPKEIFLTAEDVELPEMLKGDEKYIGFVMTKDDIDFKKLEQIGTQFTKDFAKLAENYDTTLKDFEKDGNKYSFKYDMEDCSKELLAFAKYAKENNSEVVNTFKPLVEAFSGQEVADTLKEAEALLKDLDTDELKSGVDELKELLKGSKVEGTVEFGEDSIKENAKFVCNIEGLMNVEYDVKAESKKAEVREIKVPTDVKYVDYFEFVKAQAEANVENIAETAETLERDIVITCNGEAFDFETPAVIKDGRTLVPYREFFEKLGAEVEWNQEEKKVTTKKGNDKIEFVIGSDVAKVNDKEVKLDAPAVLVNDRTLVPLRFASETFGLTVKYSQNEFENVIELGTEEYFEGLEKAEKEAEKVEEKTEENK